jgi:hypothetical protein
MNYADRNQYDMRDELKELKHLFRDLIAVKKVPFPPARRSLAATSERGVYIIRDPSGAVVHVGRTPRAKDGIRQRLKGHLAGRSSFVKQHLARKPATLRGGFTFQALPVADRRLRALLEAYATGLLCPRHIGLG